MCPNKRARRKMSFMTPWSMDTRVTRQGGRAAEKKTASADAEMTEKEEKKEEPSWTRVGGTRKTVVPVADMTKPKIIFGYLQLWAENDAAVKVALDELGATQARLEQLQGRLAACERQGASAQGAR